MTSATIKLIEAVERLNMTGEIGDGMVANLHELAGLARLEQGEIAATIAMTIAAIKPHVERAERFQAKSGEAVRGAILGQGETPANLPTSGSVVGRLPMRRECICMCHTSPGRVVHFSPCCR
jgi:hypothetical protein